MQLYHFKCYICIYIEEYNKCNDEFLDEKGDEWLPLGKSFQEHVKLYIRYRNLGNAPVYVGIIALAVYVQKLKLKITQKELSIILSMYVQ